MLAVTLLAIGGVWLSVALAWEPYVEPGAGSISCGKVWDSPVGRELEDDCRRAIDERRRLLVWPVVLVVAGVATAVIASRRTG